MYNLASKLLAPLFDPLVLAILLAVCALLVWKRRRLAGWLLAVSIALLLVFTSNIVSTALVRSLEDQYRDSGLDVPPAQAIVVLGGALRVPTAQHRTTALIDATDRLLVALRLYRSGKAPLVFCSGGMNPLSGTGGTPEAVWMAQLLEEWNIPQTAIQTEGGSINTRENAILSYRMLAPSGIRKIILVTSAMHMPRAAGAFRKAGFEVIAVPADYHSGWGEGNPWDKWIPSARSLVNSDAAIYEWLGLAIYRLRGWV
jgi:uncharacterized SAM-binding protein YcdF (DUF218 family)